MISYRDLSMAWQGVLHHLQQGLDQRVCSLAALLPCQSPDCIPRIGEHNSSSSVTPAASHFLGATHQSHAEVCRFHQTLWIPYWQAAIQALQHSLACAVCIAVGCCGCGAGLPPDGVSLIVAKGCEECLALVFCLTRGIVGGKPLVSLVW